MREAVSHEKFRRTPEVGVEELRAIAPAHDFGAQGNIAVFIRRAKTSEPGFHIPGSGSEGPL
jgi:hypothetical protein